jgi:hypothetical protein
VITTTYTIEDGISPPPHSPRGLSGILQKMQPGQSVLVHGRTSHSISGTIYLVRRNAQDGRKYMTRKIEGGIRVWRVK